MIIKIKKFHRDAVIPAFQTAGAACVDLVATQMDERKNIGEVVYKLGFGTEIPKGYKACFAPRSSFTHKGWVMANSPAQIDSDYRGEWMIKFEAIPDDISTFMGVWGGRTTHSHTFTYPDVPYLPGERVAQMWLEKVVEFEFEEVEELSETARGEGGFGHTGK